MSKPIYILGIGLSHDGATCLLKDGEIVLAIEKERLSRIKHDGGNDFLTTEYCLNHAGISVNDLTLIVQAANFEKDEIAIDKYKGNRFFNNDIAVPVVTISHHLAHAYSAVGTSPFEECNVMVIDGCGSFYHQCDDIEHAYIPEHVKSQPGLYGEKDSFYFFDGQNLLPLYKDFSIINFLQKTSQVFLPTSNHSIGGLYAMASNYCFGDFDDAGKLMGLAPYGRIDFYTEQLFNCVGGNVWINEAAMWAYFTKPVDPILHSFKENFSYFADIACWVQDETERAILYLFKERLQLHPHPNLCYAGGVALNAVANTKIYLQETSVEKFYIEPAAGDNGLAIGCAFYGWLAVLKKKKIPHNGSTFFGNVYHEAAIVDTLSKYEADINFLKDDDFLTTTVSYLLQGKTIAWFQGSAEFGPRALGRRSIIADPRIKNIKQHINEKIKKREDFRPFAPAVLYGDKDYYFELGLESPYMILIDNIKDEWKEKMPGIVHVNGTCRVQTVRDDEDVFHKLLTTWKNKSGIAVLLNTSFNKKGMPIVETPADAISFFVESDLDILIMHNFICTKKSNDKIPAVTF
jgi:carbamoyltransferase